MSQQIVWGIDRLQTLPPVAAGVKVMLVADSSFPYLSIRRRIEESLGPHVGFDAFGSNPLYEDVCKGVELFVKEGCSAIVAVGGGSSIDVAKCIKLFCRLAPGTDYLKAEWGDSRVPLIAIPTTAGTGSESTRYAVIYRDGAKQSVAHSSIVPDYALLEPAALSTLPLYQKKCTLLDALCQGIESWWSVNSTTESISHSTYAVETIMANMDRYLSGDPDAARAIMDAANRAGQAISITQTTAPHAFSYKLTSLYSLPHGHAVALCLPPIWRYMLANGSRCSAPRGWDHLQRVFESISHAMQCDSALDAVSWFQSLLSKLGMQRPHTDTPERDLTLLSQTVNPVRLKNSPVAIDQTAAYAIYKTILL